MFKVDDRVQITHANWPAGTVGTVRECNFTTDNYEFYFVDVDDYSDTMGARLINAAMGVNHGWVPFFSGELEVI